MRRKNLLGIAISLLFIYLSLKNINFDILGRIISEGIILNLYIFSGFLHLFSYFIRAVRWQIMLRNIVQPALSNTFGALVIGFSANNFLPLRLGEVVRSIVLGLRERASKTTIFTTVILERFFDGAVTTILALMSAIFIPIPRVIKNILIWAIIIFFSVFPIYYLLVFFKIPLKRLLRGEKYHKPSLVYEPLRGIIEKILRGFEVLNSLRLFILTVLTSFLIWIVELSSYHLTIISFGSNPSIFVSLILMVAINLAVMIPSMPAYLGVFEYAAIVTLTSFGFTREEAFLIGFFSHFWRIVVPFILSFPFVVKWNIKFKDVGEIQG